MTATDIGQCVRNARAQLRAGARLDGQDLELQLLAYRSATAWLLDAVERMAHLLEQNEDGPSEAVA